MYLTLNFGRIAILFCIGVLLERTLATFVTKLKENESKTLKTVLAAFGTCLFSLLPLFAGLIMAFVAFILFDYNFLDFFVTLYSNMSFPSILVIVVGGLLAGICIGYIEKKH